MDTLEQQTNGKPPSKGGIGAVVGIIVIIILLALGSLYYFTVGIDQIQQKTGDTAMTSEDEAMMLENMSQSNELDAVETDLGATDFSGLDQASADIDASLQTQ